MDKKQTSEGLTPVIDNDPERNRAADKYIELYMGSGKRDRSELIELAKTAGKALANRFVFALDVEDEAYVCWFITPKAFWEENGYCSDMTPPGLPLPDGAAETMDSCFEIYGVGDAVAQGRLLLSHGFQWDKGFQDFISHQNPDAITDNSEFIRMMEKAQNSGMAGGNTPPQPQSPAP